MALDNDAQSEIDIRAILDDRIDALHARDARRFLKHYQMGFSTFELGPPLEYLNGDPSNTEGLEKWFASFDGEVTYRMRDLRITANDGVGYAHSLYHFGGTKTDGECVDMWSRQTICLAKMGGEWKITHAHTSVPFNMDAEHRAVIDLKP
ncbi:MAG: nuclear transport factor 2 family protein [Gemmatimonadaceae bacterium]|nr:nuclear transport factor 2 family protein [Gemmatimonadaceae bacterium]